MSEPDPKPHLATCFLWLFLLLSILVKGLKETDAKRNRCANDLSGEMLGKDKGRERKSKFNKKKKTKEPSDCNSGLKPVKKREAGGLDEESLGPQCCSGWVSARPRGCQSPSQNGLTVAT